MVIVGNYLIIPGLTPETEWSNWYGGPHLQEAYSAQETSDGGFVIAGGMSSRNSTPVAVLVRTDQNGNELWNKTYANGFGEGGAYSVQQTSDSGYVLAGWTRSISNYLLFASWLVKVDAQGNMQFNKTYGGLAAGEAYSVRQTSDGGYIVAGSKYSEGDFNIWLVKTDFDGNLQWSTTYSRTYGYRCCVRQTSDGGYIVVGGTSRHDTNKGDVLLVKIDANGNTQWNRTYGGPERDWAWFAEQTSDGGYIIAATTISYGAGSTDVWLIKTSSNGSMQQNRTYGGDGNDDAYSIQETNDGGYIIGGESRGLSTSAGPWVMKVDSDWNTGWTKSLRDVSYYYSRGVCAVQQTLDGGYIVAGTRYYRDGDPETRSFWLAKVAAYSSATSVLAFLSWSLAIVFGVVISLTLIDASRSRIEVS